MDEAHHEGRVADRIDEERGVFGAAVRRGDARAAAAVYTECAILLPPAAQGIEGREAIEAFWRAGFQAGVYRVDLEPERVRRQDRLAYEVGSYRLGLRPAEGGTVVDRGKYLLVHELQHDGTWRRAVEMFNPDRPPARAGEQPKEVPHA